MDDTSGKFVLVMLRADQVRVHHRKSKHEYRFGVSGNPPKVGTCVFHPNPAAPINPTDYREEAQAAAQWFIDHANAARTAPAAARPSSGWINV